MYTFVSIFMMPLDWENKYARIYQPVSYIMYHMIACSEGIQEHSCEILHFNSHNSKMPSVTRAYIINFHNHFVLFY